MSVEETASGPDLDGEYAALPVKFTGGPALFDDGGRAAPERTIQDGHGPGKVVARPVGNYEPDLLKELLIIEPGPDLEEGIDAEDEEQPPPRERPPLSGPRSGWNRTSPGP